MTRAITLALLLAAGPAGAQSSQNERYWIFFADRGPYVAAAARGAPAAARALARRALRGSQPYWADARVSPAYLDRLRDLGVVPVVESRWLNAVSAPIDARTRDAISALPFVSGLRAVARLEHAGEQSGPAAPYLGGIDPGASAAQLEFVNAHVPLAAGLTGAGVRLGFLDTLFDFGHPALAHVVTDGRLVGVQDFTGQSQSNFHGLSVSSIAMGADDGDLLGPAHGAQALAATTEYAPTETHAEEDYFIAGLEWLEANGVDVVNVSLGYQDFDPAGPGPEDYDYADFDGDTTPFTRAVDRAASLGVLVVVAAGNQGNGFGHVGAPADADSALTVGAATSDSVRAGFSSFGPTFDGRIKPDVAALGVGVIVATPGGGYFAGQGTSFATPMVAAVACQVLEADPTLTPMEVIDLLRQTASQAAAPDTLLGWGIIDAAAAVAAADNEPGPSRGEDVLIAPNVARAGDRVLLSFDASGDRVWADLFDVVGRRVASLLEGVAIAPGPSVVAMTVPRAGAGTYLVRVRDGDEASSRVLVIRE